MKEPKYKIGDLLYYDRDSGTKGVLKVTYIEKDKYGQYMYFERLSDTCLIFIYEDAVKQVIIEDSDEYKEYQLYLKLKDKFN